MLSDLVIASVSSMLTENSLRLITNVLRKSDASSNDIASNPPVDISDKSVSDNYLIDNLSNSINILRTAQKGKLQQQKLTFTTMIICIVIGSFLLLWGVYQGIQSNTDIAILCSCSGIVTEIISGIFFKLYEKTNKELQVYMNDINKIEKVKFAIEFAKQISDENIRNKTISEMMQKLIN